MKVLKEFRVVIKNLHWNKNEILLDYTEFEVVGELASADHIRQTRIRFRNTTDYESYINALDRDYESEHAFLNATPQNQYSSIYSI